MDTVSFISNQHLHLYKIFYCANIKHKCISVSYFLIIIRPPFSPNKEHPITFIEAGRLNVKNSLQALNANEHIVMTPSGT